MGDNQPGGDFQVVNRKEPENSNDGKHQKAGPELLGELIDRHAAALEFYAAGWCDCPEDVLQEVLIELAARATVPEAVLPWLYRAVRNRAINASRSRRRRKRYENEAARQRSGELTGPSGNLLDAESASDALASLPESLREPIVAHLWGGLTFREIGQLTGTSESTAHRRYQDALRQVRETLMRESCVNEKKK